MPCHMIAEILAHTNNKTYLMNFKPCSILCGQRKYRFAVVLRIVKRKYLYRYRMQWNKCFNLCFRSFYPEIHATFCRLPCSVLTCFCLKYLEQTLCIPHENIFSLSNAISSVVNQYIERLKGIIRYENGEAEVFVYYAGHGFPDESTKMAYLMLIFPGLMSGVAFR